jgi:ATP-binding cassette subfamily F protein 3
VKVLLNEPDLLVLDEPTNYLDLPTTQWLEAFLKSAQPAVLVVSHDRYFLDKVTGRTLEVTKGRVRSWKGNYSRAMVLKEESAEADRRAYENQLTYIAKEEEFIRRHIGSQRTKEAIGRRTRLKRLERLPEPESKTPVVSIRFGDPGRSAYTACEARGLTKRYGDRTLFEAVNLKLDRGTRLGIVGPNGAGKTTLLSILRGRLQPDDGEVRWGTGVEQAWFDQEHGDLNPNIGVLDNVRQTRPDLEDQKLRTFLGAMLFSGDDVFKEVSALSGGEKARVSLAKLLLTPSNFLVLDEPTNHLDIRSRAAVEAALDRYDGTMIIVSHDRYLLDKLATQVLVLGPTTPKVQLGNYTDYVEREQRKKAQATAHKTQQQKQQRAQAHQAAQKQKKRRSLDKVEADIEAVEERIRRIEQDMANPDIYADGAKMKILQRDLERAKAELTRFEQEWEAHAE